jgi:hypothetical protein
LGGNSAQGGEVGDHREGGVCAGGKPHGTYGKRCTLEVKDRIGRGEKGMSYKTVHESFWTDPKVRSLSPNNKLLFLYLITNPQSHYSGIYYLPEEIISLETSLPLKIVKEGINTLSGGYLAEYDRVFSVVWVVKMAFHQLNGREKSQQLVKGVANHLKLLHNCPLIKDFLEYYKNFNIPYQYPIDTISISHAVSEEETEEETEEEYSPNSEESSDDCISLSNLLLLKIRERKPDFHPNPKSNGNLIKAWAKHIRLMLINDKRSPPQIRAVIEWCQEDSFWQNNILSTEKLRKQFDQLELKMSKQEDSGYGIYDNGKRVR